MALSASSSSNNDELFIINVLRLLPRPRFFRDRSDPLTDYDDVDFKQRFSYLISKYFIIYEINTYVPLIQLFIYN